MKWRVDRTLALVLALGLLAQALVLVGDLHSPYGRTPINDAQHYWDWGGRIASGQLVGDAPFFSAPLYPYLLGLLRALGFGLVGVMVLQLALHMATGALLARIGARLFDRRVGLVACVLLLLATDPAASHGRILAGTVQTFLVAAVLDRALALAESPSLRRSIVLGLLTGVTALAWPALLPACGLLTLWAWWIGAGPAGAAALAGSALLAIAPATVHNLAAADVFVPISAHAGITFWHGNNPSANGVFAPHEVSSVKSEHDQEALALTREALGPDADWGDVSGHFMGKGLDWWKAEPGRALGLAFKKAWLFLSARVYGDMYLPTLERDAGMWTSLWLAPVPVAWLVLPALVAGLLLLRRDPRRFAPTALVLLLPFAICTVFWYSPRYRLPAVPAAVLLSAWAAVELWTRRGRAPLLLASVLLATGSVWINRAAGFDGSPELATEVELRGAAMAQGEGELSQALTLWEGLLRRDPEQPDARWWLAWTLSTTADDGLRDGARALELAEGLSRQYGDKDPRSLDVVSTSLAEVGRTVEAVEVALRAARMYRAQGRAGDAAGVDARLALFREGRPFHQEH